MGSGWKRLRDFFFPPFCLVCDGKTTSPGDLVCAGCWDKAGSVEGTPFRITPEGIQPLRGGLHRPVEKHGEIPRGIYGRCACRWNNCSESILHAFKYKDYPNLALPLAKGMINMIRRDPTLASGELIVPVPLTAAKRRERGYNQAELLGGEIADGTGMVLVTESVRRQGRSKSQTKLSARQRKENVRGVFQVTERTHFAGRRILVADDVVTTGATAGELGALLLGAGAASVRVVAAVQAAGGSSS